MFEEVWYEDLILVFSLDVYSFTVCTAINKSRYLKNYDEFFMIRFNDASLYLIYSTYQACTFGSSLAKHNNYLIE